MGVNKRVYTNHELARRYAEKQMIVGERLRFKLLDNDRVTLTDVLDKSNTGRIEIPSFITDITIELGILGVESSPFKECKYNKIYICNRDDIEFNARGLCSGIKSNKLSVEFKNPDRVIDMSYMFYECNRLESLDISSFDTRKVTDMNSMFNWCKGLEEIDISNLDMSGVESIYSMFNCCKLLRRVDMSKIKTNTNKVTDMSYLFNMCYNLEEIDISGLDTSKVEDMRGMFKGCESLKDVRGRLVINDKFKMFVYLMVININTVIN